MDCVQYREQFTDFLEGTLPEDQWRELEAHLQQCPACAADIKAFRQTVSALSNLELVEPPSHLVRAIRQRIAEQAARPELAVTQVTSPARRRFSWQVAGALAAAGLMVAFVAVYGIHSRWSLTVKAPGAVSLPAGGEVLTPPPSAEVLPSGSEIPVPVAAEQPAPETVKLADRGHIAPVGPPRAPQPPAHETVTPPPPSPTAEMPVSFGGEPMKAVSVAPEVVGVQVRVDPPRQRTVGEWGRLSISVTADGDVPQVRVRVVGEGALQVKGSGLVYEGALTARRPQRCTAQIQAKQPGDHRLSVMLNSDTPGVSTRVPVVVEGYQAPGPAPASDQTYRQLRSVLLAEAARLIAADCGLTVKVHTALAGSRVTADFSGGMSGPAALRLLAQMAGGQLQYENGTYRLVPRS